MAACIGPTALLDAFNTMSVASYNQEDVIQRLSSQAMSGNAFAVGASQIPPPGN